MCLKMAAKYQGVRAQSLKSNKHLLDMITFPHFCVIEEDVNDLHQKLLEGKMLMDDLYWMYFKLMETSAVFLTDKPDPVVELENIASAMREQLGECERLFVKKTSLFKKLYDKLDGPQKEEFARQLSSRQQNEDNEEEEGPGIEVSDFADFDIPIPSD